MEPTAELGEDLRRLRARIDALEAEFCHKARQFQRQGGHLREGAPSAVSWLRHNCKMSSTSAADRLCVGKELESLPKVGAALAAGEIGYRSTSVLCHLRDKLGDKRDLFIEDEMLVKGELGAPATDVELSLPVSSRTVERFACDCTMSRVLMADSQVLDVDRATRTVSPPTARALRVRDKGCRWPGCDRPVNWTTPHHIEFWARDHGPTNLPNLVSVCHFHHRQVHEGGWQVVKAGREFRFLPPDRTMFRLAREPGARWAA